MYIKTIENDTTIYKGALANKLRILVASVPDVAPLTHLTSVLH